MTDTTAQVPRPAVLPAPFPDARGKTPAGLQSTRVLTRRRFFVAGINLASMAALSYGLISIFGSGGWTPADIAIFVCFLVGAPWTVMGFWNAILGLWLLHGRRDGLAATSPFVDAAESDAPIRGKTAVCMFLRNEDAERALSRLAATRRSLNDTGYGGHFDVLVLSDSDEPDVVAAEEAAFERWRSALGPSVRYRRRAENTGFKAGNIRDFLRRWGSDYDFFLPLDSDSVMSGRAILKLQRVMEAYPRLGILQSLVVGAPAESAFGRVFQFGMRAGMRSFTMGAAWW
ncbi:MAG: glycosyltransferase, partial [Pseudomonadota bacterium]